MADQNPSDTTPSLPPIPNIPFQSPSPDQSAPSTPTEMAAASLSPTIESDLPISEVVTAMKSPSQTPEPRSTAVLSPDSQSRTAPVMPVLTEVKTETVTPAPIAEPRSTAVLSPAGLEQRSMDSQSGTTTTVTVTPAPKAEAAPAAPVSTPTAPTIPPPAVTTTVSVNPVPETPKGPLYEDPDKVRVPGAS